MQERLKKLDLNLFRVLSALVRTGSTQQSARLLGISQPSVSRALAKLRQEFGPELFQRLPQGLEPSPLARELAAATEQMYAPLESVLAQHWQFEPERHQGEIRLAVARSFLPAIGPPLIKRLASEMPRADFSLVGWGSSAPQKLLAGEYHYGIQIDLARLPKSLHTGLLLKEELMMVARRGHPGLTRTRQLRELADYPLVRLYLPSVNTLESSLLEQHLTRWGFDARVRLKSDDLHTLITILRQQDAILVAGNRLIAGLDPELEAWPMATDLVQVPELTLYGVYSAANRNQPLYQFLDQQARDTMQQMVGG